MDTHVNSENICVWEKNNAAKMHCIQQLCRLWSMAAEKTGFQGEINRDGSQMNFSEVESLYEEFYLLWWCI